MAQSFASVQIAKKNISEWRFRSSDLWVMGPTRFLCANPLMRGPPLYQYKGAQEKWQNHKENIFKSLLLAVLSVFSVFPAHRRK
jgi:hypothetical protein